MKFRSWVLIIATAAPLAACGIDQGGTPAPPEPQTASVTYGSIDGFGSIVLNGETIPTANALFLVNGVPGVEADLRVGQIVRVISTVQNNVKDALVADYQSNIQGQVAAVDAAAGTITVLAQTIQLAPSVALDVTGVATLADLNVATPVEISGLTRTDGSLFATYVGTPAVVNQFGLSSTISAVDLNAMSFMAGGITVDYSQAAMLQLPGGMPAIGQIVRVVGTQLGAGGELIADEVVAINSDPGLFGTGDTDLATSAATAGLNAAELTGFDASFIGFIVMSDNASTLTINDVTVSFDATTTLVGGTANDLNADTLVQIRGDVTGPGAVRALEIIIL